MYKAAEVRVISVVLIVVFLLTSLPVMAGTLEGEVEVSVRKRVPKRGSKRRPAAGLARYKEDQRGASDEVNEAQNVVVYVPGLKPSGKSAAGSVTQRDRTFIPFVTAVTAGSTVNFPNEDIIFHSVYSNSPARKFHLPEYPQGETRSIKFDKPGHVELFCAIHSHMNAHILVLENDYFVTPDKDGKFKLELPAGSHVVKAWHPRLGASVQTVTVPQQGAAQVKFSLK